MGLEYAPKDELIMGCGISEKIDRRLNTKKVIINKYAKNKKHEQQSRIFPVKIP